MDLDLKRVRVLQELSRRLHDLHRAGVPWAETEALIREVFPGPDRPFSAMLAARIEALFPRP